MAVKKSDYLKDAGRRATDEVLRAAGKPTPAAEPLPAPVKTA